MTRTFPPPSLSAYVGADQIRAMVDDPAGARAPADFLVRRRHEDHVALELHARAA